MDGASALPGCLFTVRQSSNLIVDAELNAPDSFVRPPFPSASPSERGTGDESVISDEDRDELDLALSLPGSTSVSDEYAEASETSPKSSSVFTENCVAVEEGGGNSGAAKGFGGSGTSGKGGKDVSIGEDGGVRIPERL